jgi:ElaB/YqjD/DUF883 family membrane-anchored ribosome-binding protein
MNKLTRSISDDFHQLVVDAEALVSATADVSTETVAESRQRLTETLAQGKKLYGDFSGKAYDSALNADEAATKYVYHAVAIVAGAFLGFFTAHRCISKRSK